MNPKDVIDCANLLEQRRQLLLAYDEIKCCMSTRSPKLTSVEVTPTGSKTAVRCEINVNFVLMAITQQLTVVTESLLSSGVNVEHEVL